MKKLQQQFSDSYKELRKINTIVLAALLIAIGIVLGYFSIQVTPEMKIGVAFITNQLTAVLFGPGVAGIVGGVSDILKFLIKPTGAFFIGWTLNAMVGPMIYGMMLYKKKLTFWRILASKAVVAVIVNMGMGTLWLSIMYGKAFIPILLTKAVQESIQVPIQSVIFWLVIVALRKTRAFEQLSYVEWKKK